MPKLCVFVLNLINRVLRHPPIYLNLFSTPYKIPVGIEETYFKQSLVPPKSFNVAL